MYEPNVIGLDLSLTGAGVAVVTEEQGVECFTYGRKGKKDESLEMRLARMKTIRDSIRAVITTHDAFDLCVIESASFGSIGGSAFDRAGLWWITYDMVSSFGVPIITAVPAKVKMYATGRGNADKDEVLAAVVRRYPDAPVRNNNEADAVVLAAIGRRHAGSPIEESLPQTHLRAMDGLVLP